MANNDPPPGCTLTDPWDPAFPCDYSDRMHGLTKREFMATMLAAFNNGRVTGAACVRAADLLIQALNQEEIPPEKEIPPPPPAPQNY